MMLQQRRRGGMQLYAELCVKILLLCHLSANSHALDTESNNKQSLSEATLLATKDHGSKDLLALAQSYFIVPETPSTSTVKPTFTRRKTLRPISSLTEVKKKKDTASDDGTVVTNNYNPFRQIVDTGFQVNKQQHKKKRPSSVQMTRRDQNNNSNSEQGLIGTLNQSSSSGNNDSNYEVVNSASVANQDPTQQRNNRRRVRPTGIAAKQNVPVPNPQRFTSQRRTVPSTGQQLEVQASTTAAPIIERGRFRQNPHSRPPVVQALSQAEAKKPLKRRKKIKTTAPLLVIGQQEEQSPNIGGSDHVRRSSFGASRRQPAASIDIAATINPVESSLVQQDIKPLNRIMRHRPHPVLLKKSKSLDVSAPQMQDSVQESSSDTVTILATGEENIQRSAHEEDESPSSSSTTTTESSSSPAPYSPRNLSSRRNNPLDSLHRQSGSRRLLSTKNSEGRPPVVSTTKPPPTSTTPRVARKSPLSLAYLKNRRLGGSTTTSTTTETPQEVLGNLEAIEGVNLTDSVGAEGTNDTQAGGGDAKMEEEGNADPPEVENKSPLAGLLKNRRPLRRPGFPSNNNDSRSPTSSVSIPIKPRGLILKPKTTVATTQKPTNVETTTPPSCEDGKRYNKVLRKCIPAFSPRSG